MLNLSIDNIVVVGKGMINCLKKQYWNVFCILKMLHGIYDMKIHGQFLKTAG